MFRFRLSTPNRKFLFYFSCTKVVLLFIMRLHYTFLLHYIFVRDEGGGGLVYKLMQCFKNQTIYRSWIRPQLCLGFHFLFLTPSSLFFCFVAVPCPNCRHDKAAYKEVQTRSADEPATLFFKCLNVKCGHNWREG